MTQVVPQHVWAVAPAPVDKEVTTPSWPAHCPLGRRGLTPRHVGESLAFLLLSGRLIRDQPRHHDPTAIVLLHFAFRIHLAFVHQRVPFDLTSLHQPLRTQNCATSSGTSLSKLLRTDCGLGLLPSRRASNRTAASLHRCPRHPTSGLRSVSSGIWCRAVLRRRGGTGVPRSRRARPTRDHRKVGHLDQYQCKTERCATRSCRSAVWASAPSRNSRHSRAVR